MKITEDFIKDILSEDYPKECQRVYDNRGRHFICSKCGDWKYYTGQKYCGECGSNNN